MKKIFYYALIIDLILIDQLSKWAVSELFIRKAIDPEVESIGLLSWIWDAPERLGQAQIEILPFFNLVMVWNKGISFGMFNRETDYGPYILIVLALIVSAWFTAWLVKSRNTIQSIGLAMVVGGAIGNVIDRFRFGAVMDFLDFHILGHHWPAFNVADSSIVLGVIVLMIHALFLEKPLHKDA
jgi:signal peptidase II